MMRWKKRKKARGGGGSMEIVSLELYRQDVHVLYTILKGFMAKEGFQDDEQYKNLLNNLRETYWSGEAV